MFVYIRLQQMPFFMGQNVPFHEKNIKKTNMVKNHDRTLFFLVQK